MSGTYRLSGFRELEAALKDMDKKVAAKFARAAVRKAGRPILVAARSNVPVNEGRLKRSLALRVDRLRSLGSNYTMSAMIHVTDKLGPRPRKSDRRSRVKGVMRDARYSYQIGSYANVYGAFIEFGVGVPAQPFLTPAWDRFGGTTALHTIRKSLSDDIYDAARQARKG